MGTYESDHSMELDPPEKGLVQCAQDLIVTVVALAAGRGEVVSSKYPTELGVEILRRLRTEAGVIVDLHKRISPELMTRLGDSLARIAACPRAERITLINAALWGDADIGYDDIGVATGGVIAIREVDGGVELAANFADAANTDVAM